MSTWGLLWRSVIGQWIFGGFCILLIARLTGDKSGSIMPFVLFFLLLLFLNEVTKDLHERLKNLQDRFKRMEALHDRLDDLQDRTKRMNETLYELGRSNKLLATTFDTNMSKLMSRH